MKRYLNWKTPQGVETLDELDRNSFNSYKDFKAEQRRLSSEYNLAGMSGCYWSQRACKGWG